MPEEPLVVALGERRYRVERRWCRPSEQEPLGFVSDLVVDSGGFVHVGQRGTESPVLVFDPTGAFVRSWGKGAIADVHYLSIDADDQILLADRDAHQILAFGTDGRLRFALGERHAPRWQAPFNHPTAASMAPDGEVYVSDGYGNSAVHRFSADGALRQTWGGRGAGSGEFTTPHCVWVDRMERVLVCDRENDRLQVFDRAGTQIAEWGDFYHPMKIYVDDRDFIFVTDQIPRISMLDPAGELAGRCRGAINGAHGLWGDRAGNLYLAELPPEQVTRLTLLA
ncbi:MAG: hypothetical protein OXC01_05605 [Immundisolibacterales bacterium]|nr:hypothetical protein [Immundisolibacterales bacterium]